MPTPSEPDPNCSHCHGKGRIWYDDAQLSDMKYEGDCYCTRPSPRKELPMPTQPEPSAPTCPNELPRCPKCDARSSPDHCGWRDFDCRSVMNHGKFCQSDYCTQRERDALAVQVAALRADVARLEASLAMPCECCNRLEDEEERSHQLARCIEKVANRLRIDRNDTAVDEALSEHTEDDEEAWGIDAMHRLIVERIDKIESALASSVPRPVAERAVHLAYSMGCDDEAKGLRTVTDSIFATIETAIAEHAAARQETPDAKR